MNLHGVEIRLSLVAPFFSGRLFLCLTLFTFIMAALVSCHIIRSAGNQSPTDVIVYKVNDKGATTFLVLLIHSKTEPLLIPQRIKCIKPEIGGKVAAQHLLESF